MRVIMQTLTMKLLLSLNKDLYRALADEADMVDEKMRSIDGKLFF